jgi:IclR family acetate operon transcriptional repressor
MSGVLARAFRVIEHLVDFPDGRPLSGLASDLGLPLSATHRMLTELIEQGYVRQQSGSGQYVLTFRLVSMGLSYLANSGVVDLTQPMLDSLAEASGELVRLAVVDGDELTFVAKSQGARAGLRYDPDMGLSVNLACSAAGHAWLSTMTDEEALALVSKQGFGKAEDFGKSAPRTFKEVLSYLRAARKRGFSLIKEVFAPGMGSISVPVYGSDRKVVGVITVAGPLLRFNEERMLATAPILLATAKDVARASGASAFFKRT